MVESYNLEIDVISQRYWDNMNMLLITVDIGDERKWIKTFKKEKIVEQVGLEYLMDLLDDGVTSEVGYPLGGESNNNVTSSNQKSVVDTNILPIEDNNILDKKIIGRRCSHIQKVK